MESGFLSVRNQYPSVSGVTVRNGGSFELELGGAGANTVDRFPGSAALTLGGPGGGGVIYNTAAAAPTVHSQVFSGVTLGGGANEIRAVIGGTAPNFQDMTYNLGTITPGTNATLNLARSAATGTGNFILANPNGPNGIIGPWLTFNSADWAISSAGLAGAFAAYTANTWGAGLHTNVTAHGSLTNATTGTLRFNTGNAVRLSLTGTNVIESGGIISQQGAPVITGGTLTSGSASGDLYLHAGGGGSTGLLVESVIADGAAAPLRLTKSLFGTVTLAADNTYTGGTTHGAGLLVIGAPVFGGGSTGSVAGPISLGNLSVTVGQYLPNGFLAINRAGTYTLPNAVNPAVNAGGMLEQWSTGNLVINQAMKIGGLRPYAGTITLDFAAPGAPASELIDGHFTTGGVTVPTARLTARSGTLTVRGKGGAATVQSFALTDCFGASTLHLQPGAAGGTVTLALGAQNRGVNSADGGGVFFLNAGAGTRFTTTDSGISATNPLLAPRHGIPYLVIGGNDWAARDAAAPDIVPGAILPGFYTPLSSLSPNTNADYDAPATLTADTAYNSLRFNLDGGTLTTNAALQPGGILVTPAAGSTTLIDGGGFLRANSVGATGTATDARDLVIVQNNPSGKLRIAVPVNNFDANNRTELTKAGPGELELTGVSTYTGRTFIGGGITRFSGGAAAGSTAVRTGSLLMRSGEVILQDNAGFTTGAFCSVGQRVGEEATLTLRDNAIFDIAADFNIGDVNGRGTLNLADNANLRTRSWFIGKAGFAVGIVNQTGGTVVQSNTSAGDWNLGGNTAGDPAATGIYNLSGGLFDAGPRNYQIGRFGIGTMNVSGGTAQGTAFQVIGRFGTGVGTLNLSGGLYDAVPQGIGALYFIVGENGRATLNVSGTGILRARNLSLAHNGGTGLVVQTGGLVETTDFAAPSATIPGGVVFGQTAAPGLVLPDYSASYHLKGGTLRTFGMGENTAITTPIASSFRFDGGTLQATAGNPVFIGNVDNVIVEDGGAVIDSNTFDVTVLRPLIHDPSPGAAPDGGLTKLGDGTLTLAEANTYTGDTRVFTGTLALNTASLADTADVRLSPAGALTLTFAGTDTVNRFWIDGTARAAGTWGSLTSTATHKTGRITGDGILLVTQGPSAASGYSAWAALPVNGLTPGVNDGQNQDPDGDTIPNLMEFVLDGNPSIGDTSILPVTTVQPTTVTVAFKRRDDSESVTTLTVQNSPDLLSWTGPVDGQTTTVTENGAAADDILVTIPRGASTRLYTRLKVISIP